jgi:hypothetical protein
MNDQPLLCPYCGVIISSVPTVKRTPNGVFLWYHCQACRMYKIIETSFHDYTRVEAR